MKMLYDPKVEFLRADVLSALAKTSNVELLHRVQGILKESGEIRDQHAQTVAHSDNNPFLLAALLSDIAASRGEFEDGEMMTLDELLEESKSWA